MKNATNLTNILLSAFLLLLITACSVAPTRMIWRPWTRVMSDVTPMASGSRISVSITGKTIPLIGDESIFQKVIKSEFENLIIRRGFTIDSKNPDYSMAIQYEVTRRDLTRSEFYASQSSLDIYSTKSSTRVSSKNLGAAVASAIVLAGYRSQSVVSQVQTTEIVYTNIISLECRDSNGILIWKGESSWDSEDLDSRDGAAYALRLLTSDLPKQSDVVNVPMIKKERIKDYLRLNVGYRSFSSPALPYEVTFLDKANTSSTNGFSIDSENGLSEDSAFAYAGFVDLVTYAETALPNTAMSWEDPLDRNLWKTVTLGGLYKIGDSDNFTPLMISLRGTNTGYIVSKSWIATSEEYAKFQADLNRWQLRLSEFFNVFE